MTNRIATVSVALTFAVCGCGSSSPASPSRPTATSPTPSDSSATAVKPPAQAAAVEVSLVSVVPGTPSGDGDWCIGDAEVELIAHVVDVASQSVVTEGQLWMQFCVARTLGALNGFAKEDCEATGPPRWLSISGHDLAAVNPADFTHNPGVLALGVRFQFRPASGGEFQRATSVPFNLDTTCGP